MKMFLVLSLMVTAAMASVEVYHPASTFLGSQRALSCGTGLTCAKSSGKMNMTTVGGLINHVAATATTITSSQCGSTFVNAGAVQMELPAGSAALIGCRLTFITGNATNFDLNPATADTIILLTNAAGDAIRNATLGNTVTIQLIAATSWAQVSAVGTWTDIN